MSGASEVGKIRQIVGRIARERDRGELDRLAEAAALPLTLLLPLMLLHARAGAEILIGAINALFLVHVWAARDGAWLRCGFALAAGLWWLWLVVCSALGQGLGVGLVAFRLPLLALALGCWGLRNPLRRRALYFVLAVSFGWIVVECWQQMIFGTNLFGQARWGDGALTGPFSKPRAGPALILLAFPVVVPAALALLARPGRLRRAAAAGLVLLSVATVLLVGQRMPSVLLAVGLGLTALLLPALRWWLLGAIVAGAAVVAAMPLVSPAAYGKLVLHFRDQIGHFWQSPYGQIFAHATALAQAHPWAGQGFDAFRRACAPWQKMQDFPACNLHPHNYYLEAADNGGALLLALFTAMAMTALIALWRRIGPRGEGVGLFVGAVLAFWPIASTSAFTSMPNGGWIFLLLGLGMSRAIAQERGAPVPRRSLETSKEGPSARQH